MQATSTMPAHPTVPPDTSVTRPVRMLTPTELTALLDRLPSASVALIGDYCLDCYWFADPSAAEISIETGLTTRPVKEQRYSLGGAGNVAANLAALGCGRIHAFGVVGNDPWGREMLRLLGALRVDTTGMLQQETGWSTLAYCKPHVNDTEESRIDFGNFNQLGAGVDKELLARLEARLDQVDVVIINQQVKQGIHSAGLRAGLAALIRRSPKTIFIADSRHFSGDYPGAILKLNDRESARLCGAANADEAADRDQVLAYSATLRQRNGAPVIVTRGDRGIVTRDASGATEIPAVTAHGPIDTVGAGDSVLAGVSVALATKADLATAAQLGNLAAAVTIRKLRQTGTATPAEVQALANNAQFRHHPELADHLGRARHQPGTTIEVVNPVPAGWRITHAVFDHDGTISTLRQGWEAVMEPMMVRAVLGPEDASAGRELREKVAARVREFIDRTTGAQTLVQMHGLVDLVKEFGCVPAAEIRDPVTYKQIYLNDLMISVTERRERLRRGEIPAEDFEMRGAAGFLQRLHAAGVKLYMVSGTDRADVQAEAEALGYAKLFEGRIYGSEGVVLQEAKRIVLDRIVTETASAGATGIAIFGDGPVEIREAVRHHCVAVGIASDEVHRTGLNEGKRRRLILAGADLIIPDYTDAAVLLRMLGVAGS